MRLCIFDSLYQKEKDFFKKYESILSVTSDSSNPEFKNIFMSNMKIIYDRHNEKDKQDSYNLMNELLKTNKVKFDRDIMYKTIKNSKGVSVTTPLPQDRIILKFIA